MNWHGDRAEIEVNGHQIVIRDTAISAGATKNIQIFSRVVRV